MKRIITLSILCFAAVAMFAQAALKVAETGKVGIGVDSPTGQLEVAGDILLNFDGSNKNIVGGTNNARRLAMASSTTSNGSSAFFTMWGDETHNGPGADPTRAGELAIGCGAFKVSPGKSVGSFSSLAFEVKANGETHAYAGLFTGGSMVTSDKRLKNNVTEFTRGLDDIMQINPRQYYYNGKAGTNSERLNTGVLAQEFQKIAPEGVTTFRYEDKQLEVEEEYLAVDAGMITFMLVNAVKEQQTQISERDTEIEDLRNELSELRNLVTEIKKEISSTTHTLETSESTLGQNVPNPFNGETRIAYSIPEGSKNARIDIFNLNGQLITSKTIDHVGQGELTLDASTVSNGQFTYSLLVDNKLIGSKKMIVQN